MSTANAYPVRKRAADPKDAIRARLAKYSFNRMFDARNLFLAEIDRAGGATVVSAERE